MSNLITLVAASLILTATASGSADAKSPQKAGQASETKFCFAFEPSTGSRISRSECKTKSEWSDLGVDVDEMLKKEPTRK